jgi:hypothetical protein
VRRNIQASEAEAAKRFLRVRDRLRSTLIGESQQAFDKLVQKRFPEATLVGIMKQLITNSLRRKGSDYYPQLLGLSRRDLRSLERRLRGIEKSWRKWDLDTEVRNFLSGRFLSMLKPNSEVLEAFSEAIRAAEDAARFMGTQDTLIKLLVGYAHDHTRHWCDPEIAVLLKSVPGYAGYTLDAHQKWRLRHKSEISQHKKPKVVS